MGSLPLHPAVVHFPVAILIIIGIIGIISLFIENFFLKRMIFWLFFFAIIFAIAAIITGLYESNTIVHDEAIHEIMEKHETNGFIVTGFFLIMFIWYWVRKRIANMSEYVIWVIIIWLGIGLLAYQNYLGGEMVYGHGAAVKPMENILNKEPAHEHDHPGKFYKRNRKPDTGKKKK